jgi:DNA-binding response OmpR family regulator
MPRVLVVEDERKVLRSLKRGLQAERYEVVTAAMGEEPAAEGSSCRARRGEVRRSL